jgi:hypothetical protein
MQLVPLFEHASRLSSCRVLELIGIDHVVPVHRNGGLDIWLPGSFVCLQRPMQPITLFVEM